MKKLILLCDYGLDDAAATVFLLRHADRFSGIDILPVGGNVPKRTSFRNAKTLLSAYDGSLSGVRIVDTSSLCQPEENLTDIHGEDGMGDLLAPARESPVPILAYDSWVREAGSGTVASLGPCTVTADLLNRIEPEELLLMGGNVSEEPNFRGREFNHAMDISAFAECVRRPHRIATLDTCRAECFNAKSHPIDEPGLLGTLIRRSVELGTARHEDRCFLYDYIAVQALIFPERFAEVQRSDPDGNRLNVLTAR